MVLYSPTVTGSLTLAGGTITVSGSSINNLTASFATTASFALNAGGGAGFPFIGAGNITGSLVISSSNASSSLVLRGSGSGVFTVDGTSGRLFSVDDSLSGSLFSVNTTAGLPVMEAFSDNTVRIGQYNRRALFVSQSVVGINKETALNGVLDISGSVAVSGSILVSGSITTNGTITAQTLVVQTITSSITYSSGSNIFGNSASNNQILTGSVLISGSLRVSGSAAITGSIDLTSTIYSVGENRMSQGTFNDPVPNIVAVLKLSSIPSVSLPTTVIGARISGSAASNVDTYAGYFNNISTVSGTGLSYGIFASGAFHNFGGETRFYQGTFNDPIVGTVASVKISAVPTTGAPSSVFTVGITGAASSGQNTFAGYFTNTSTVSGGGVNYGIYATGSNHFFGGNVGVGTVSPTSILHISASSSTITGKVILQSPSSDSGILQIGSTYGEASMMFIPGVTSFGASSGVIRTSTYGNSALWGLGPGTYTTDPTKFGIANVGVGTNVLTVSSSGALGIGTTTPTTRLFVLGSGTYGTPTTEILTSDATIFSSEMSNDAYNSILQLVSVRQSLSTGANSNGFLGFSTIDDSNGEGIRDAGRVAIVNETGTSRNSATALSFWTNPGGTKTTSAAEKLRLTSGGYLRLASSGIQFQGATAAANALNYYEEGSWTPALQNATVSYSTRSGTYVRIGNYVFVRWGFLISSISGTSGTVTISGLPFTSVSWGSYQEPNISVSTGVLATANNAFKARVFVQGGGTSLVGRISDNADTPWTTSDLQNGSWIIGEIFYNIA
jgi:hypothetical protein